MSLRRLVSRYDRLPQEMRMVGGAFAEAIAFYGAAVMSEIIAETAQLHGLARLGLYAGIFVLLFMVVFLGARLVEFYREEQRRKTDEERGTLLHSYALCDRIITNNLRGINEVQSDLLAFVRHMVASKRGLQDIVEAAYNTFEAAYGKKTNGEERIDFEVTFMTKSYADGEITIPAAANKDGRAPRSMVLRNQNPKIYEHTVTASIYQEPRPSIKIVENTRSPNERYEELYPDQKRRIRSSIIYPVLSDTNQILGTLVVHCDKDDFFKHECEKYWSDLMEVFVKRLALAKTKLDMVVALTRDQKVTQVPLAFDLPF